MSVVEYHTGRLDKSSIISEEIDSECAKGAPMRYRGWVLLALGFCSWAGLLKICGWL